MTDTERVRPVRLRLSRARGFDLQALSLATNGLPAVNVARPSKWGNPFIVGKHGTRAECVEWFRLMAAGYFLCDGTVSFDDMKAYNANVRRNKWRLRDHNLFCWCALDGKPCHADTLLEIANRSPTSNRSGGEVG